MAGVVKKAKTDDGSCCTFASSDSGSLSPSRKEPTVPESKSEESCENSQVSDKLKNSAPSEDKEENEKRLRETDVGITEYISQHEGFSAVIKQRFSDFIVNEVGLDGNVIHLTDISPPSCDAKKEADAVDPSSIFTEEQLGDLKNLSESGDKDSSVTIKVGEDKSARARIHQGIRSLFPKLASLTEEDQTGAKVIKVIVADMKSCKDKRFLRKHWPSDRENCCHFVLYKENKDTMEAVNLLAKLSKTRAGFFSYAGTKDRRAKTSQMISVQRMPATRLHGMNKVLKGMKLGNFKYCKNPLKLGDHRGNAFNIVLRNVTGSEAQIQSAMTSLGTHGFINYYGMQRFGTTSVPTHHIGRAILKCRWEEAVDLILQPRNTNANNPRIAEAGSIWMETRDAAKALAAIGNHHCLERSLLEGLSKRGSKDLVNALSCIPRHMRQMYIHSYQSFIWNRITSRRIRELGIQPVLGDLVQRNKRGDEDSLVTITAENLSEFQMSDVVLPLPGHEVSLPENEVRGWYEEMLSDDELQLKDFKHKVKDYCMPGEQRHIMVKPGSLTWETVRYDDVTLPLTLSDLDRLEDRSLGEPVPDGKYLALILSLQLPPSSYATMAIREIIKEDTSSVHQTTLNVT